MIPMLLSTVLALAAPLAPSIQAPDANPLQTIEASVVTHQLENGWTFLIVPRHSAPVVSFHTYIDVGAIFEEPGATGMAHMFEHMAFKGSDRLGTKNWPKEQKAMDAMEAAYLEQLAAEERGDQAAAEAAAARFASAQALAESYVDNEAFSRILEGAGGARTLNASTSAEETQYMVSLPSNQVELWCWMERERFARPVLRKFYKERDAVLEERAMRVDSSPFGLLLEALLDTAFTTFPYKRPVIGYADDLQRYTRTQAEAFYAKHYGVRRFVTAIVGDVDPKTLIAQLERYFGDLPAGPERTTIESVEPKQTEARAVEVVFPAMPILMMAWHAPALSAPDFAALELGLFVLAQSETSRTDLELVREQGLAAEVGGFVGFPGNRYPNLAILYALPTQDVSLDALAGGVRATLGKLIEQGPTDAELAAAKTVARANLIRALADNEQCAATLTEWQSKTGDWRNAMRRTAAYEDIQAQAVQAALAAYLSETNCTTARLLLPEAAPDPNK